MSEKYKIEFNNDFPIYSQLVAYMEKLIVTNKKNNIQIRTLFHNPRKIILNKNQTIFINE